MSSLSAKTVSKVSTPFYEKVQSVSQTRITRSDTLKKLGIQATYCQQTSGQGAVVCHKNKNL